MVIREMHVIIMGSFIFNCRCVERWRDEMRKMEVAFGLNSLCEYEIVDKRGSW